MVYYVETPYCTGERALREQQLCVVKRSLLCDVHYVRYIWSILSARFYPCLRNLKLVYFFPLLRWTRSTWTISACCWAECACCWFLSSVLTPASWLLQYFSDSSSVSICYFFLPNSLLFMDYTLLFCEYKPLKRLMEIFSSTKKCIEYFNCS